MKKFIILLQFTDTLPSDSSQQAINSNNEDTFLRTLPVLYQMLKRSRIKPSFFANKRELHRLLWFYPTLIMKPVSRQNGKSDAGACVIFIE